MKRSTVGSINQKQKSISLSLIRWVIRYQKFLQTQENVKYGRKAKSISFVLATKNPRGLAQFIINGGEK